MVFDLVNVQIDLLAAEKVFDLDVAYLRKINVFVDEFIDAGYGFNADFGVGASGDDRFHIRAGSRGYRDDNFSN